MERQTFVSTENIGTLGEKRDKYRYFLFSGIALQTCFWHVLTSEMKGKYVKGFRSLWKRKLCAHKGTIEKKKRQIILHLFLWMKKDFIV